MSDEHIPRPFKVRTLDGVLHSSHPTIEQAEHAARTASERASTLGVSARYGATDES